VISVGRWRHRAGDWLLAACFVAAAAIEAVVRFHDAPMQLLIALSGSVTWAALVWRRSRPLLTVVLVAAVSVIGSALQAWLVPQGPADSAVAIVALLVASYSLGAHGSRWAVVFGAPLPALLIVVVDLLQPTEESLARAVPFAIAFVVVVPVAGGRLVRARTRLIGRLRTQSAELEAHRGEQVATVRAQERLRLGELFHVRLLAGLQALGEQIERAAGGEVDGAVLTGIERSARTLLTETRQAVVALSQAETSPREPAPVAADRPAPGWDARPWTALGAAAVGAGLLIEVQALGPRVPMPVAVFACALLVIPLGLLWKAPLPFAVAQWGFTYGFGVLVAPLRSSTAAIGLLFAVPFAVAALTPRRAAAVGLVVSCAGGAFTLRNDVGGVLIICVASWLVGSVLRERVELVEQLRHNAALLAEQRKLVAQRAVLDERERVARDLHDAVGHSLTVVSLQAGAARRLAAIDPGRVSEVLRTISTVTQEGVRELAAGRASAGGPVRASSLADLLDSSRLAGLSVEAEVDDDLIDWSESGTGSVVFRMLQESLTNVLKHAPGAAVQIAVHRRHDSVVCTVSNTAGHAPGNIGGTGRGLAGMRARLAACGGRLDWGRQPGGGFALRAEFPLTMAKS
jgi:signal transduction histidine kinase